MQVINHHQGWFHTAWRLCFIVSLLLVSFATSVAQEQTLPLEEEPQRQLVNFKGTKAIYFKDINHILDKFVGSWKGTSVRGYDITIQLKIFRKVYQPAYWSYADLLGFKLEISKDGKKETTPLNTHYLIPETEWYRGSGLALYVENDLTNKNGYRFYLDFNGLKQEGYHGWTFLKAIISEDGKTLTLYSSGKVVLEGEPLPNYPPYIPKKSFSVAWVLHRVDK